MAQHWVWPDCTAIPDGIDDAGRLRLSIDLRPVFHALADSSDLGFLFGIWPKEAAKLRFEVEASADGKTWTSVPIAAPDAAFEKADTAEAAFMLLWLPLFTEGLKERCGPGIESAFALAVKAWSNPEDGSASGAMLADEEAEEPRVGGYSYSAVSGLVEHTVESAIAWSLAGAIGRFAAESAKIIGAALAGDDARRAKFEAERDAPFDPVPAIQEWRERAKNTFPDRARARAHRNGEARVLAAAGPVAGVPAWEPLRTPPESLASVLTDALPANAGRARALADVRAAAVLAALDDHYAPDRANSTAEVDEPPVNPLADQMRRRIAGLQAHPTLRKFLRLIADIKLDRESLERAGGTEGWIRVRAVGKGQPPAGEQVRTAYLLSRDAAGLSFFEPRARHPAGAAGIATIPLDRGVVRLAEGARFELKTMDAVAAAQAFRSASATTTEAHNSGVPLDEIPIDPPQVRTRGIMLLDRQIHEASAEAERADRKLTGPEPKLLYAEDLSNGFRPAVVRPADGALFSPVARRVIYPGIYDALGVPTGAKPRMDLKHPYPEYADRDWGMVTPTVRMIEETDEAGKAVVRRSESEVLFTWSGEPMAVPSVPDDREREVRLDSTDLPVTCWVGPDPAARWPQLRAGGSYKLMMLAVKPNGSSIPLAAAQGLVSEHALGTPSRSGGQRQDWFVYKMSERSQAPDILIPADDRLVRYAAAATPNETERTLVIRSGGRPPAEVTRVLIAPPTSLDRIEQFRLLDKRDYLDRLKGSYRYVKAGKGGGYPPVVRKGQTPADAAQQAAGRLFALGPRSDKVAPHFVEPGSQYLGARFRRGKDRPASYGKEVPPLAFWKGPDPGAATVKPIFLTLRPRAGVKNGGLFKGSTQDLKAGDETVTADQLVVELAPAEEVELDLWCFGDTRQMVERQLFAARALPAVLRALLASPQLVAGLNGFGPTACAMTREIAASILGWAEHGQAPTAEAEPLIQSLAAAAVTLFTEEHVPGLMDRASVRLVHAVPQPLRMPRFLRRDFRFVRVTGTAAALGAAEAGGPARLEDTPGGTAAYLVGSVELHRASTRELRFEAGWYDFGGPDALVRTSDGDGELWVHKPVRRPVRPAILGNIGRLDDTAGADELDMEVDEAGVRRRVSVAFDRSDFAEDTIARRVAVRIVGESRFVDYFKPEDGPFTLASAAETEMWRALDERSETSDRIAVFWMKATTRPPVLTITGETTIRRMTPAADGAPAKFRLVRRLWLGRDFYLSGEGELVALVCTPPGNWKSIKDAVDRKAVPAWAGAYMTQWAGDPTLASGQVNSDMPSEASIHNHLEQRDGLFMPAPSATTVSFADEAEENELPARVRIFAFKPSLDPRRGEWYVDINVDPQGSYASMLRLGVARYQPNALAGLELSAPLSLEPFVINAGWDVIARRSGNAVEIKVFGAEYRERAPALIGLEYDQDAVERLQSHAHSPNLQFEVVHGETGIPVVHNGDQVGRTLTNVTGAEAGRAVWSVKLDLPESVAHSSLRVVVSEVVTHVNADAAYGNRFTSQIVTVPSAFTFDLEV